MFYFSSVFNNFLYNVLIFNIIFYSIFNIISFYFFALKKPQKIFCGLLIGYVLLSQDPAVQVPSAMKSLTAVFEMGTGVSSSL